MKNKKILSFLQILLGVFLYSFGIYFLIFPSVKDKCLIFSGGIEGITCLLNMIIYHDSGSDLNLKLIIILSCFSLGCVLLGSFFLDKKTIKKSLGVTLLLICILLLFDFCLREQQGKVFESFTLIEKITKNPNKFYFRGCFALYPDWSNSFCIGFVFFGFSLYFLLGLKGIFLGLDLLWQSIITKAKNKQQANRIYFILFWGFELFILCLSMIVFDFYDMYGTIVHNNDKTLLIICLNLSNFYLISKNLFSLVIFDSKTFMNNNKISRSAWFIFYFFIFSSMFFYFFYLYFMKGVTR